MHCATRAFLLMLTIFMAACVPDSKNPLTEFDKGAMDASVYGTWFWKDEQENGYLHFGQEKDSGLLQMMMIELNSSGKISVTQMQGYTSRLGGSSYLNLKFVPPQDGISEYVFMKYEISEKGLGLAFMDPSVIEKAIADNVLAGRVEQEGHVSSVHLSDTSDNLQQFVRNNELALFPEMKFLPRLALPGDN
ncbi:MAG: hypothetical protein IZT60_00425 [Gammaproteobacteria bacterium]|nr:hypothetical protein [Gammaproteobacteria bacterium]